MDKILVSLFICGFVSILFQGIGIWSPAWLLFDVKIQTEGTQISENVGLGLFMGHACVESAYSDQKCGTFTMDRLTQTISQSSRPEANKTASDALLGTFLPIQILTIVGGLGTIVALILSFKLCRKNSNDPGRKSCGIVAACLYILSAVLLIGAVAYGAHQNEYITLKTGLDTLSKMEEFSEQLQISVHFPWAVAMTGVGALFSIGNGLIVLLQLCYADKFDAGVSTWNKFTNQAV